MHLGYIRIVIADLGSAAEQNAHELHRRAVPRIVDVPLEGRAQDQDLCPQERLGLPVEGVGNLVGGVERHARVDLGGQLDELGIEVELARLPGQIIRVDRNAVASHAGPGVEGHEAEGLRRGRVDDLPDVDVHPVAELGELVHQGDVHAPENVLQKLAHLGHAGTRDPVDLLRRHQDPEQGGGGLPGRLVDPPYNLGGVVRRKMLVSRVDPLGGEREQIVSSHLSSGGLQDGTDQLFRGAGIRRGLENDQGSRRHMGGQGLSSGLDIGEIRRLHPVERRGHADHRGIGPGALLKRGVGAQRPRGDQRGQHLRGDVGNIAHARVDAGHPIQADVDSPDPDPCPGEAHRQRQTDVPQTDDRHRHMPLPDLLLKVHARLVHAAPFHPGSVATTVFHTRSRPTPSCQDPEIPAFAQAAQKGPDARRNTQSGVPTAGGSRRTPGTPQRVLECSNAADGPFSAAC